MGKKNFDEIETGDIYAEQIAAATSTPAPPIIPPQRRDEPPTDEEKQEALEKLGETVGMFLEVLEKYAGSIFEKAVQELKNSGITGKIKAALERVNSFVKEVETSFPPYLESELVTLHKDFPETSDISAPVLLEYVTYDLRYSERYIKELCQEHGIQPTAELLKAFETAITNATDKYFSDNHGELEAEKLLPTIKAKRLKEIGYPLDKVNGTLWAGVLERGIKRELKAETDIDSRRGKQANIYVLIDFDELDGVKISRNLDSYDKRVFIAVANLKRQGLDYVTAAQVYRAMGGRGTPSRKDRDKILESVKFISMGRVFIDNSEEAKLYKKYDRIKESFPLLATAIGEGYVNSILVDDVIHIIEDPRLITFAENRGQIATVPIALLESPISMTAANLTLEDYLFTRIARMRNTPALTRTILFATIHERCGITTKKQKQRLPEKLERILEHYKTEKWIKGYTITDRSIEIETYKK